MRTISFNVSKQKFGEDYFERKPLLMRKALNVSGFALSDIDSILGNWDHESQIMRILKNGQIDEAAYMSSYKDFGVSRKAIDKPRLYGLLRDGATLVLNGIDKKSSYISSLCNEVALFSGHQTRANGYLAFGAEPSFGCHWDTHDVFAIQLLGRKRWQLYAPTFPLPMAGQASKLHLSNGPTVPDMDVVLEAGDVLYLPRGWWHDAIAFNEQTFHIAVGVHVPHVADYISWVCGAKLKEHLPFRKAINVNTPSFDDVEAMSQLLFEAIFAKENLEFFCKQVRLSARQVGPFDLQGNVFPSENALAEDSLWQWTRVYSARPFGEAHATIDKNRDGLLQRVASHLSMVGTASTEELREHMKVSLEQLTPVLRQLVSYDAVRQATAAQA